MLNRLTERAKDAILNVSTGKTPSAPSADALLVSIRKSGGIGTFLLKNNPGLEVNKGKIDIDDVVEKAYYYAAFYKHMYVGTEHLLLAVLELSKSTVAIEEIKNQIKTLNTFPTAAHLEGFGSKTPVLDSFGLNLNKHFTRFRFNSPVHREGVDSLISVLLQKENPNPLIIGDAGVGKHSLVELLVHKINSMDVPVPLTGFQVIELDVMAFIATLSGREGFEAGITTLLEEIDSLGDVILYIKDFQNLFIGTNSGFAVPLAFSMLKSYLASSGVSIVGTMNTVFHDRLASENAQILNSFEELTLDEPNEKKAREIIGVKAEELGSYHNVKILKKIEDYAFNVAKGSIRNTNFPQKGVSLLDQACSKLLLKENAVPKKYKTLVEKKTKINDEIIKKIELGDFSGAVGLKSKLSQVDMRLDTMRHKLFLETKLILTEAEIDEALEDMGVDMVDDGNVDLKRLGKLADDIKEKIIGQDIAVNTVSRALVRAKLGLRSKKRPLGNFLFLGPTGVGKTELGKVLATTAFGEDSLIRLDMSDFSEKHNVARLVGAPPGYVGFGEGGELTSKIENKPNSVVLFDEIEKAHPDVLNILLQVMEEGELVDARGQTFDFSQAVVVLTSNLGTDLVLRGGIGFDGNKKSDGQVEDRLLVNLKKIMKPELLNRFDEVVVFKSLKRNEQMKILDLLLLEVKETLQNQNITLKVYSDVKKLLLEKGYNDEYGARALRRTLETELLDKIAEFLLKNSGRPLKIKAKSLNDSISITQ